MVGAVAQLVIEIVDAAERLWSFVASLDGMRTSASLRMEKVEVLPYGRAGRRAARAAV